MVCALPLVVVLFATITLLRIGDGDPVSDVLLPVKGRWARKLLAWLALIALIAMPLVWVPWQSITLSDIPKELLVIAAVLGFSALVYASPVIDFVLRTPATQIRTGRR